MNKLVICGLVLLSTTATPQHENPLLDGVIEEVVLSIDPEKIEKPHIHVPQVIGHEIITASPNEVAWYDVAFIEEDNVELGFDTAAYLPEDFDAHAIPTDLAGFNFMEEEIDLDPSFDTTNYLPEGFDPFDIYIDLDAIIYLEDDDLDLGFDTAQYLPIGFDPYHDSIVVY